MVDVYNLYLGGFLPDVSPESNVHNRRELKFKFNNILTLNKSNPLIMVRLSNSTQAYALNVKESSIELGEAAHEAMDGDAAADRENSQKITGIINKLLKSSDEYGSKHGRFSRLGGELRNFVRLHEDSLKEAGYEFDEEGYLGTIPGKEDEAVLPASFLSHLQTKSEEMSMNPMTYVEKKVYSYAHLYRNDIGCAYQTSIYSGMLFNSYC